MSKKDEVLNSNTKNAYYIDNDLADRNDFTEPDKLVEQAPNSLSFDDAEISIGGEEIEQEVGTVPEKKMDLESTAKVKKKTVKARPAKKQKINKGTGSIGRPRKKSDDHESKPQVTMLQIEKQRAIHVIRKMNLEDGNRRTLSDVIVDRLKDYLTGSEIYPEDYLPEIDLENDKTSIYSFQVPLETLYLSQDFREMLKDYGITYVSGIGQILRYLVIELGKEAEGFEPIKPRSFKVKKTS